MKAIYTLLIILIPFLGFGQKLLKEITKTFNNGQPMFIDYLEVENLKKVKNEIYNINGELIFSVNYNPISGLPEGEFFDKKNKGFFKNGELTCYDCILVEENIPSVFSYNFDNQNTKIVRGNVINGRYEGKIEEYGYRERTISQVDWNSTRRYIAAGLPLGFRDLKTYGTGDFIRLDSKFYNYNSNGMIDGWHELNDWYIGEPSSLNSKTAKAKYVNGVIESFISYDNVGNVVDSLSNNNELWKINYKWKKNDGHLVFYETQKGIYFKKITKNNWLPIILIGGLVHLGKDEIYTPGGELKLDNNGIYSIQNEEQTAVYEVLTKFDKTNTNWNNGALDARVDFLGIYNFLKYDDDSFLSGSLYNREYYGNGEIPYTLIDKFYRSDGNNPFPKYMKQDLKSFKQNYLKLSSDERKKISFYNDLFFTNTIALSDFLKGLDELIGEEKNDIYILYVWDKVNEKYERVNLKNLIDLAIQKEKFLLNDGVTKLYCEANKKMYYKNEPIKITRTNRELKILFANKESYEPSIYDYQGLIKNEKGDNLILFQYPYDNVGGFKYVYEYGDAYYLSDRFLKNIDFNNIFLEDNFLILCDIYNNSFNRTDSLNALNEIKILYEQEKLDKKLYKKLKKRITPK